MNLWATISKAFGTRRSARAQNELATAYRSVFSVHERESQIVLADLAHFTGFYRVNGPGFPADERAFADGMRAAYGRIFQFLRMTDDERRQLEEAARQEAVTDAVEGEP